MQYLYLLVQRDFKMKYWTKEDIYKMIEPYRLERNINKYLDKQNGIL